jgi:hypothetical protein
VGAHVEEFARGQGEFDYCYSLRAVLSILLDYDIDVLNYEGLGAVQFGVGD